MKFIIALFLLCSFLGGATVDFRGGKILNAELSLVKPPIREFNPKNYTNLPEKPLYAALTILCDDGRRLSIHDFGLDVFNKVYPCIAIQQGTKGFSGSIKATALVNPKEKYTLLFVLDANASGLNKEENITVKALCPPEKYSRQVVTFKNLEKSPFTSPARIPAAGLMPEKK